MRLVLLAVLFSVCPLVLGQTPLRTKVFPGAQALPLMAGVQQKIFERHGIQLELLFTTNSQELRDDLANGSVQVAHSAVDNAVAMVEMAKHDVVIVTGGDSSMNEFFVQPEIRTFADLKGRTVIVDAVNTAYALQAKKILRLNGLQDSDYTLKPVGGTMFRYRAMREDKSNAASMLNPPFSLDAPNAGLKSLGRAIDLIGPYQATGGFALRKWAAANADLMERYLAAHIEATRWTVTPANKDAGVKMLAERFKLESPVATRTWELLADPKFGLAPDAQFNMAGFRNVLALRAEIEGSWGGTAPAPDRYVDLKYYEKAKQRVGGH
jgi:ABC-type nitrate/sulfonate/bicarbonate transport system substrate-binding protein